MVVIDTEHEFAYLLQNDSVQLSEFQVGELIKQIFEAVHGSRQDFLNKIQSLPNFHLVLTSDVDVYALGQLKSRWQEVAMHIFFKLVDNKLFVPRSEGEPGTFNYFAFEVKPARTILMPDRLEDRMPLKPTF